MSFRRWSGGLTDGSSSYSRRACSATSASGSGSSWAPGCARWSAGSSGSAANGSCGVRSIATRCPAHRVATRGARLQERAVLADHGGRRQQRGAERLAVAGDRRAYHVGVELEVAGQALERELARLEDLRQPRDLVGEHDVAAQVEHGPVEQMLVVVDAPLHARGPVALALVCELLVVAPADLARERGQVELGPGGQPDDGGRRHARGRRWAATPCTAAGAHS